jgi:hypothetical protein
MARRGISVVVIYRAPIGRALGAWGPLELDMLPTPWRYVLPQTFSRAARHLGLHPLLVTVPTAEGR